MPAIEKRFEIARRRGDPFAFGLGKRADSFRNLLGIGLNTHEDPPSN